MILLQGNCSGEVPEALLANLPMDTAPLRPLLPGQCLIIADAPFFVLGQANLWLDGVYVRRQFKNSRAPFSPLLQIYPSEVDAELMVPPRLWMTNVTLQVCEICNTVGLM